MDIEHHDELIAWLRARGHLAAGEPVHVQTLAGGVSCATVLVQRSSGPDLVVKQALQKLRVQQDWFSDPARIHREAAAMRQLNRITSAGHVPRLYFEDHALHLLAMEAVPSPHDNWKTLLLSGQLRPAHVLQFGQLLAEIHRASYNDRQMREEFQDRQFMESLRIEPYYAFTAQQVPQARKFLLQLIDETRQVSACLVHGDYSPKNILIHRDQIWLVDHEVMHFGDGAFDIGFSLTHFLSKARHLTEHRSALLSAARLYWATYRQGFPVDADWEQRAVRHTIACLLARVAGKSPLEYLNASERHAQRERCIALIALAPSTFDEVFAFLEKEHT